MEALERRRKRVLLLTASVGTGHNQAARAVEASLREGDDDVDVGVVDVMDLVPRWFRAVYAGGFVVLMTRLPWLYGLGYAATDRPRGPARSRLERQRLRRERALLRPLEGVLAAHRPDLIVHTHFLAPPKVAALLAAGRLHAPQMVVVTDQDAHRWWYCERVAHWFLPSERSAGTLAGWGVPPERITVSGIPILPRWYRPVDADRVRAAWGLAPGRDVVVVSGGAAFTCGPVLSIARGLLAACPRAEIVVLAGRNKPLLARLCRLREAGRRLHPFGFTDRVHELVSICSLLLTKPGGVMTSECLARGTPMLLLKPVPGQEARNARYLAEQGAAVVARGPRDAARRAAELLAEPGRRERMAANARRLHRPANRTIAARIRQALGL